MKYLKNKLSIIENNISFTKNIKGNLFLEHIIVLSYGKIMQYTFNH